MKKLFLIFSLIIYSTLLLPSAIIKINNSNMLCIILKKEFNDRISSYVDDVGIKYKYSSRAKDFLTEETLKLVIKNCESYPSIIIAISIIETGWGKYAIGNNHFGIKGKGHVRRTKEWTGNKYITITDSFQEYKSKAANIRAVSVLLHNKRYNIGTASNYKEAAHLVKNGGYATDPIYANKLKFIIEKYELYRLDEIKDNYELYV